MLVTLAMAGWAMGLLVALFFLICLLLILVILIQRPEGGGLAGAFGSGAGSGQTAFGAKTGDALTIATISVFLLYLATAVGLNYVPFEGKPTDIAPAAAPAAPTDGAPAEPSSPFGPVSSPAAPVNADVAVPAGEPAPATPPAAEPGSPAPDAPPAAEPKPAEPAPSPAPAEPKPDAGQ